MKKFSYRLLAAYWLTSIGLFWGQETKASLDDVNKFIQNSVNYQRYATLDKYKLNLYLNMTQAQLEDQKKFQQKFLSSPLRQAAINEINLINDIIQYKNNNNTGNTTTTTTVTNNTDKKGISDITMETVTPGNTGNGTGKTETETWITCAFLPQGLIWQAQLDNINNRMGDLRLGAGSSEYWFENVWLRAYGEETQLKKSVFGVNATANIYGMDIGTDVVFRLDDTQRIHVGAFVGYGQAEQKLDNYSSIKGTSENYSFGLYGAWIHEDGWYVDAVGKVQLFENKYPIISLNQEIARDKYNTIAAGLSLEAGRRITLGDGWFLEPQVQVGFTEFSKSSGSDYAGVDATSIFQVRGGLMAGKTLLLDGKKSALQLYVKLHAVEQVSSGGNIHFLDQNYNVNLDGARIETGAGVIWQIGAQSQLHLGYKAAFAEHYTTPWSFNLGFRWEF